MKGILFRLLCGLPILALSPATSGCGPDFYLSESETAAYAGTLSTEASANNFISSGITNQVLDIQFDNNSQPPAIRSTNLVTLMRDYTTLGVVEGINHQVQLDRLNGELQKQIESWIRDELQIYMGSNNAGVRLSQLSSIQVRFLDRPTFTFHPERRAIAFSLNVRLTINGTIEVDVLDDITDFFFDINGSYPLSVDINDFNLNGEATLRQTFADAAEITLNITPQTGAITVSDNGSSAPTEVKDGVRTLVGHQLSQPLTQSFTQRYDYFALTGLGLTQGTAQTPSTLQYMYRPRPEVARPMLHIVARAADGKLSHLRKTEGGQSIIGSVQPFPNLTTRVENEPALFASAADQLELAATTTANELVYAHWRDETWINQTTFAPNGSSQGYTGKPALIASQPGQVEIIVVGRNGGLWHVRRLNGRWIAPAAVPLSAYSGYAAPPFRDPVAVQNGNKVVVVFVDAQNRLLAMAFDLESGFWGQPTSVTSQAVNFAPAAAASGDGRVDVVYVRTSGTPFHLVLDIQTARFQQSSFVTGISILGSETNIGGVVNSTPVLLCSSYRQLELVGRGTDDRVYHNHFAGPASPGGWIDGRTIAQGWQGWTDLNGNFAGSFTFERMSDFSAGATHTGKVALVAIRQPSALDNDTQQFIYHNSYDSERFGTQPWNTVLWRGYEKVGSQRFVGRPALAVTDRHIELAHVNNTWTLQGARLSESNAASFASISNTQINSASVPVDPVMVSSGAGQSDIVFIGTDGRMRHVRRSSRSGVLYSFIFAPAFEQSNPPQPAVVGYGNGQLEIVAVAHNNGLYHWRYQNGAWTQATQLSGTAISQPILVNVGSGQLLVLAVGSDQVLCLWSFTNGAWTGPLEISTGFAVNATLFGPLAASSWGEGSVDLALVESQTGAVYHGRIGPGYFTPGVNLGLTPSRDFTRVGGIVVDTPILTAFSPTRLSILAVGTDRYVYSNWSSLDYANPIFQSTQAPPIVWSNYRPIGGYGLLLGGDAKTGANELTAVGIDPQGRLFVSRFNGVTWTQFQPVIGQNPQTQLSPPRYRPAITTFLS